MTISELIEGCAKARKSAQDFLYTKYSPRLYGVCLRYTGNRTEAQDVLQDALVKIYKNIHKLNCADEKPFYLWMHKIAINTALNYIRDNLKNNRSLGLDEQESVLSDDQAEEDYSFYDNLLEMVDTSKLLCFIQEMPCGYRTVFNLYAIENHSHKEIAEELNISVSTSKTQLFKARKMLAQRINETIEVKKIKMVI
jgi:RNA polymerase sigma-70 factor, ECF subfamily